MMTWRTRAKWKTGKGARGSELKKDDMRGKEAEYKSKTMRLKGFLRPRRETLHPDLPFSISIHPRNPDRTFTA